MCAGYWRLTLSEVAVVAHASALFLDRDGVINVDRGYVHRADQFEFVPGIFELARFWTHELRRQIVVVTNQSGIGRGCFDEKAYEDLTRWMCDRFAAEQATIARVYHCPYHPVHGVGPYRREQLARTFTTQLEALEALPHRWRAEGHHKTKRKCRWFFPLFRRGQPGSVVGPHAI